MSAIVAETRYQTCFESSEVLKLESGHTLSPVTLAYETYGTLNQDASNAILVCHALSGDAHAAGPHIQNPDYIGWWTPLSDLENPSIRTGIMSFVPTSSAAVRAPQDPIALTWQLASPTDSRFR